jgi:hypothetical protein
VVELLREPPRYPSYIEAPRYAPKVTLTVTIVSVAVSLLAFVFYARALTPLSWWLVALISVGITGGAAVLVHCPFLLGWAHAQWRRARSYEGLFEYAREITAEHALYGGVRALPVIGLQRDKERPQIILRLRPSSGVADGEYLLLVDAAGVGVVGRARVSVFRAGRCFADILESDAVLGGYLRQPSLPALPNSILVVRELDVRAIADKIRMESEEGAP